MVSVFTRSQFWQVYGQLQARGKAAFPARNGEELEPLPRLVQHAGSRVPYYAERFRETGVDIDGVRTPADLPKLPVLTKADILANFPDRITSEDKALYAPWRYVSTSGTVERMTAIHDFRKRDASRAATLMALRCGTGYQPGMKYVEIPPNVCRDVCGVSETLDPSLSEYLSGNVWGLCKGDPEVVSTIRRLVETQVVFRRLQLASYWSDRLIQDKAVLEHCLNVIAKYGPYVLKAQAVYLYLLAGHIRESSIPPPRLAGVMPMGSALTPYMKRVVEEAFACPVFEDYGCAELGGVAAECPHRTGLHVLNSLFDLEILRSGRPAKAGEVGKVFITDLYNFAMPFIRYEIGDVAIVNTEQCPCGRQGPSFHVRGRVHDCVPGKSGELLTPDIVGDPVLRYPGVRLAQIEYGDNKQVFVKVAPVEGQQPDARGIRDTLAGLLGDDLRIAVRIVGNLSPEPSGKFRLVKNMCRQPRHEW